MAKWIFGGFAAAVMLVLAISWATADRELPRAVFEKQYATPPSRFLVLADGSRIHYRDRGPRDAPVLVLLHGFAGSLFSWEAWSLDLSDHFRVVSLDLPGNGLTGPVPSGDYSQAAMTETLRQFTSALGLKHFALAGNSMGGAVAARYAERFPDQVTALILIDSSGSRTDTRPRLHLARFAAHVPVLSAFVVRRFTDPRYRFRNMEGMSEAMAAHFRLPDEPAVWQQVRDIRAPALILWGANDHLIPLAAAHAWNDALKGSKLIVYPNAGHVAMLDAPAASVRDARAFLTAHLASRP